MKSLRFSKLCARVSSSLLAFGPKTQLTISRNFITKEFVLHSDYPGMYVEQRIFLQRVILYAQKIFDVKTRGLTKASHLETKYSFKVAIKLPLFVT